MGKMKLPTIILAASILVISCSGVQTQKDIRTNNKETASLISNDSIELLALTKNLLKWHEGNDKGDFVPTSDNDSVFTGIDWPLHKARLEELSRTNFFTQEFLDNYQNIALYLDKELKQNLSKYHIGELPPYGNNVNEWCNCQDYPSNAADRLIINNIKVDKGIASYYWTWGDELNYFVKAKKENGEWRIIYLERFDIKNFFWK